MRSEQFRSGKPPVFVYGEKLQGDISNQVYTAQHAYVTSDDVTNPAVRIRASRIRMVPGQYIEAWNAVLFVDGVPAFYFPYYKRNIGRACEQLEFHPRLEQRLRAVSAVHLRLVAERLGGRRVPHGLPRAARFRRRAGFEPASGPLGRGRVQILLPARPGFQLQPGHEQLSEPDQAHSRKPAARLFRLAGDAGHEPEPEGAGELPVRPAGAARFFRGRLRGEPAAEHVRRGQQILGATGASTR